MNKSDAVSSASAPAETAVSPSHQPDDPYVAFDDLMCVIEVLCPIWPQRPVATKMNLVKL
jgi:hypothetical protein